MIGAIISECVLHQTSWEWEGRGFYRGNFLTIWSRPTWTTTPLRFKRNASSYLRKNFLPWIAWHVYRGFALGGEKPDIFDFDWLVFPPSTFEPTNPSSCSCIRLKEDKSWAYRCWNPVPRAPLLLLQVESFSLLTVCPFVFSTFLLTFIRNCVIAVVLICLVDEQHLLKPVRFVRPH